MASEAMTLQERCSRLEAARAALEDLGAVLHEASGRELGEVMTLVDGVAAGSAAARVGITVEALRRGEVAQAGTNAHGWVRDHAPTLRQGGAGHVAAVATAVTQDGSTWRPEGSDPDPESTVGIVWSGVRDGSLSPALATAVLRESGRLEPLLMPAAVPTVTRALVELGAAWGPSVMRRLRPRLLAEYGRAGQLDELQGKLASAARLSTPFVESGDLTEYQLVMTPEQASALEAAIGPLSAAAPNAQTGERDLRPAGQRRVEALTEVCRLSSAHDSDTKGSDGAGASAAAVHVSISLADLQARTGCGEVLGSTAGGTVLSPETVRRIACEADLIPHVLGTGGEDLDLGRVVRLFTRAQRRLLWHRDRSCTYPGCTAPAAWTKAHHVLHWADGGLSDIDNAALLCQRHHDGVHRRRLWAQVSGRRDEQGRHVVWDLSDGSYDRHLKELAHERSANDPPPLTAERLAELLCAVAGDDPDDQQWANSELDLLEPDEPWRQDVWTDELQEELERAC